MGPRTLELGARDRRCDVLSSEEDIIHQATVEVDERGTEAAATAVLMDESAPAGHVELTVDRPFLFYVRDRPTETPLFVGRVVDGETLAG